MSSRKSSKPKIKTEWNLKQLYKSPSDPQIERDLKAINLRFKTFAKKYKTQNLWLQDEHQLTKAILNYEKLIDSWKPFIFLKLWIDTKANDGVAEARLNQVTQTLNKINNQVLFFTIKLGQIPLKTQKKFLRSSILKEYRYFLDNIFRLAKYQLTETEEKILNLKSQPAHQLWVSGIKKQLAKMTVIHENKKIPIGEANYLVPNLPTNQRRQLHKALLEQYKTVSDFSESEINAIVNNKKIDDELRGFKTPYESTVLHYQNHPKTVDLLIKTVAQNNQLSHRFYKTKAKMLGLKSLTYADRSARVGKTTKKIPFNESFQTLKEVFGSVHPHFLEILDGMVKNGQIDVYPRQYKNGGAYCWGNVNTPTFVFLNHTDDFNSTMTFAHEMGHAIHSELSKKQRPLYQDYSAAVAEVASTLFENFVFEAVFKTLSPKEKIIALHDRIQDDIQTIFRQIACFNFEVELHQQIRQRGSMPKEEIAQLLNKHMSDYLGPLFKLTEDDGYFFVSWGHIRHFFYVYSYAHGQLISKALFAKYKASPKYLNTIINFLEAGGSKSPEDIFKAAGIDITKPEFFQTGLKEIEADIKKLEKLVG